MATYKIGDAVLTDDGTNLAIGTLPVYVETVITLHDKVTFDTDPDFLNGFNSSANAYFVNQTTTGISDFDGRILEGYGTAVASANTITLGSGGNTFNITGTTEIRNIVITNWQSGSGIYLFFTSVCPINQAFGGSGQIINTAGDFSTVANGMYHFKLIGTDWYRVL